MMMTRWPKFGVYGSGIFDVAVVVAVVVAGEGDVRINSNRVLMSTVLTAWGAWQLEGEEEDSTEASERTLDNRTSYRTLGK